MSSGLGRAPGVPVRGQSQLHFLSISLTDSQKEVKKRSSAL